MVIGDHRKNWDDSGTSLLKLEYLVEYWRSEDTYYHSDIKEKPSAMASGRNAQGG